MTAFRKSSFSDPHANCVEIARRPEIVEVRDSKVEFGSASDVRIKLHPKAFSAFIATL